MEHSWVHQPAIVEIIRIMILFLCTVLVGITLAACMGLSHTEAWFIGLIQRNPADVIMAPA